jgi:hypothetical protein
MEAGDRVYTSASLISGSDLHTTKPLDANVPSIAVCAYPLRNRVHEALNSYTKSQSVHGVLLHAGRTGAGVAQGRIEA